MLAEDIEAHMLVVLQGIRDCEQESRSKDVPVQLEKRDGRETEDIAQADIVQNKQNQHDKQ